MVHVPYKGGPDAIQAVLKGDVCCIFNQVQTMLQHCHAGKVRLLGVTTHQARGGHARRADHRRGGPAGLRELHLVRASSGPRASIRRSPQKMNAAIKMALEDPETQKKLAELGNTPRYETLEQFKATVKRDRAKWAEVVKAVGAKVD